jgi:hypothetical protein
MSDSYLDKYTFIYALVDPNTLECRYIGKSDNPWNRFKEHLKDKKFNYKYCWIQSLIKRGQQPNYVILEQCNISIWKEREKDWIAFGKKIGWPLTNMTDGGDGCVLYKENNGFFGRHHSEESLKKMGEVHKGQVAWNKGRHWNEETKIKMKKNHKGMAGKNHSEETKIKIKNNNLGKSHKYPYCRKKGQIPWNKGKRNIYSEETKRKMGEKNRKNHEHEIEIFN